MEKMGCKKVFHIACFICSTLILVFTIGLPSPGTAADWKWPRTLSLSTMAVGTTSHATATAWTPVLEKQTGMKVRVVPISNSAVAGKMVKNKTYDLWVTTSTEFSNATEAKYQWATRDGGPFPLRTVWLGQMTFFAVLVRGDSPVKSLYDIKPGMRIGHVSTIPIFKDFLKSVLAWAKVSPDDVTWVPFGGFTPLIRGLGDGKADLTYGPTTAPVMFEVASKPKGVRFIPMDAKNDLEGAKRFLKGMPTTNFGTVRVGVKEAIGVPGRLSAYLLVAHAAKDPEFIYNLAKWFDQNFDAYKTKHKNCKMMSIDLFRQALDTSYIPVHEGTIRYLREVGKWTAEDDKRQKYNVALMDRYVKAYKATISEADKSKIKVTPENKVWVDLWAQHKKNIPTFKVMLEIP
ncbi:MAG: TAXI family TRAP transporter solute-binding subunit [Deltaproteobacteria bacterium]|nr:TAXI family TRAP transporter solute-binding subunit [Deltaproteobacteria bacterium]